MRRWSASALATQILASASWSIFPPRFKDERRGVQKTVLPEPLGYRVMAGNWKRKVDATTVRLIGQRVDILDFLNVRGAQHAGP